MAVSGPVSHRRTCVSLPQSRTGSSLPGGSPRWRPVRIAVAPRRARFASDSAAPLGAILTWAALEALGRAGDPAIATDGAARLFDALRLRDVLAGAARRLGVEGEDCWRAAAGARRARCSRRARRTRSRLVDRL